MSNQLKHPYHLVTESPWPAWTALVTFLLISRIIEIFQFHRFIDLFLSLFILLWVSYKWWLDVVREATLLGCHSFRVQSGLRWGIILFIISEILFFLRFFWAFFHNRLSPSHYVGITWPPVGIQTLNPFEVPLLNTIILLRSGASVTWAHHRILNSNHKQTSLRLILTIILGVYFTMLQKIEYNETSFTIADSIYGSTFFLTTGFHGLHVIVGTIFLLTCWIRLVKFNFRKTHHFGFEAAAWYWHFVDVVWIFLFISIYWWGRLSSY
jgi:cytochrome c oxidase subunit 3